jgi:hypothetical protein
LELGGRFFSISVLNFVAPVWSGTVVTEGFHIIKKSVIHTHPPIVPKKNKFTEEI